MTSTTLATAAASATDDDGKIECLLDGARVHSIQIHLKDAHKGVTIQDYQERFPGAPVFSDVAKARLASRAAKQVATVADAASTLGLAVGTVKQPFHEVFKLGKAAAARKPNGDTLMIDTLVNLDPMSQALVPEIDENFVFSIEDTKDIIIGLALGMPTYVWGYHGTGKTSLVEQVHARIGRPCLRIQHTIDTESADIIGQWTVKGGDTVFQPGPLTEAMLYGWTYLADEYDFAIPAVTSVYQSVLEGKALVIKNAPPEFRMVKPHKNFRFIATGNTNGIGDESGLYQGTQMGNAANYSRFGMTIQIDYMRPEIEAIVIANQSTCAIVDAEKIVSFATSVRTAYKAGTIGSTISPRELINTAVIGIARANWRHGLARAYLNRTSVTDRIAIDAFAQRIWG